MEIWLYWFVLFVTLIFLGDCSTSRPVSEIAESPVEVPDTDADVGSDATNTDVESTDNTHRLLEYVD